MSDMTMVISPINVEERRALDLRPGDTVRVYQKVKEASPSRKGGVATDRVRTQIFEGFVIARKHGREAGGTFTVRKVTAGVGVERIFPLYSPVLEKIEVIQRSKVRRAKLYYVREKAAKELRKHQKQVTMATVQRVGFAEDRKEELAEEKKEKESVKSEE